MRLHPQLLHGGLGLYLAGCRDRVELPDVPIVGSTAEFRREARAELVDFDQWAGAGRVQLTELRFEPLGSSADGHRYLGYYRGASDRISIDHDVPLSMVRSVVRHELCHALDYGEALLDEPEPVFDDAGSLLFHDQADPRDRRAEALATACEIGPFGAHARSIVCDGEPELAAEIARWTAEHVWQGFVPHEPVPRDEDPLIVTACCTDDRPWDSFDLDPSATPEALELDLRHSADGWSSTTYVSLYTGEQRGWDPEPAESTWARPADPPGAEFFWGVGVSSGVGAAYAQFVVPYLGDTADRLLRTDGADWALADPACRSQDRHEEIFAADDRLWFAWDDGRWVRWRELR